MTRGPQIKALAFDAYGTLFDVHSVIQLCDELFPGRGAELSQIWRAKQLEYSWLKSLMRRYQDFEKITEAALKFACITLQLDCPTESRKRLMQAYLHLEPYPEVREALAALSHLKLAILSNGSPKMLKALVKNNGLTRTFDKVISVDELKIFKPDPKVYALAPKKLKVRKSEIGFVSSNFWDICGASSFGLRTFWVNRAGKSADELGYSPQATVTKLTELERIAGKSD
ncbi:MAG TPA: haloacid dehalogenase type II [Burkholderiales bacterium]|nr:haloacid dehalogenase type II [Burkholderiales bacterium]